MDNEAIIRGLVWFVAFLFSTTAHEAAHAFSAFKLGDPTAYNGGQVSLDPIPHIRREPFGMIVVPLLSFFLGGFMIGWASTPYDPRWAATYPRRSAAMSLAGPLANLSLVILTGLVIRAGMLGGIFAAPEHLKYSHMVEALSQGPMQAVATLLSAFFSLNVFLFAFNLIPLPPLDGSGAIGLLFGQQGAARIHSFMSNARLRFIGIYFAWKLFDHMADPIHLFAVNLLYPGMHYQ